MSGTHISSLAARTFNCVAGNANLTIRLPASVTSIPAFAFKGAFSASTEAVVLQAPGISTIDKDAFKGLAHTPKILELHTPMLKSMGSGVFSALAGLPYLELELSADFTISSNTSCGLFEGLTSLQSLTIRGNGTANVFG